MIFGRHICCALLLLVRRRFRFQLGAFHQLLREHPQRHLAGTTGTNRRDRAFQSPGDLIYYAPHRNLWIGVHYIPDAFGVFGCAPGASAQGRRHRVGATDIQQRMPDLPYDQGRRQSLGPEPPQYHRKESRFASELWLEPVSKSFEENNEAGKLDKAEEIAGVVLPANEDPALPLNPGEEALDEPASHVAA